MRKDMTVIGVAKQQSSNRKNVYDGKNSIKKSVYKIYKYNAFIVSY